MQINLQAARVNCNLSKSEAAAKIQAEYAKIGGTSRKVTEAIVTNWESGITLPNALHIKAIEKVYGVSYNDIDFLRTKNIVKR